MPEGRFCSGGCRPMVTGQLRLAMIATRRVCWLVRCAGLVGHACFLVSRDPGMVRELGCNRACQRLHTHRLHMLRRWCGSGFELREVRLAEALQPDGVGLYSRARTMLRDKTEALHGCVRWWR